MKKHLFFGIGILLTLLACNIGTSAPTPTTDLFATLAASTPLSANPAVTEPGQIATSVYFATPAPLTSVPTSSST